MYGNSKSLTCKTTGRPLRRALFGACAVLVGSFGAAEAAAPSSYTGLVPVSDAELAKMRGGFLLPNGMFLAIEMIFYTAVSTPNGGGTPFIEDSVSLDEDDLLGNSGVVHSVSVEPDDAGTEIPDVEISTTITDNITGVMNMIQNNASAVAIQNMTTVNVDLTNTGISMETFRTNNFNFQMRSLGALGL